MSGRRDYFRRHEREPEDIGDGSVFDNAECSDKCMVVVGEEQNETSNMQQPDFLSGVSMDRTAGIEAGKCSSVLRGVHGVAKRKGF